MRLVAISQLRVGQRVGQDVRVDASSIPLLRSGVRLSERYIDALSGAGLRAIYVDDEIGAGIDPQSPISEQTRQAATEQLSEAFKIVSDAREQGALAAVSDITVEKLSGVAERIVADVIAAGDACVAMADLASFDAYTLQHSIDVTALGVLLGERHGREHGWTDWKRTGCYEPLEQKLVLLGTGLLLHDIGKLSVPIEILHKPGPLTPEEWKIMRGHTMLGYRMLDRATSLSEIAKSVVRSHHERWNGSGYPSGLVEADIPQVARVAAVADVFDAMTAERPYKRAEPVHVGVDLISSGRGSLFDPDVVDTFLETVAPYPPGLPVELSDGSRGIVESVGEVISRPVIRLIEGGASVGTVDLTTRMSLEIVDVDVALEEVEAQVA